jgi:type II secretory pathway pseudopilin PulG
MQKASGGFTLIELILSLSIIMVLTGLSIPVYAAYNNRSNLDISAQTVAETFRRAEAYSRAAKNDSGWGVHIESESITLFKGTAYASRDTAYDELTALSSSIASSGLTDIYFTKITGVPTTSGTTTLAFINTNDTRAINVSTVGMVTY